MSCVLNCKYVDNGVCSNPKVWTIVMAYSIIMCCIYTNISLAPCVVYLLIASSCRLFFWFFSCRYVHCAWLRTRSLSRAMSEAFWITSSSYALRPLSSTYCRKCVHSSSPESILQHNRETAWKTERERERERLECLTHNAIPSSWEIVLYKNDEHCRYRWDTHTHTHNGMFSGEYVML